MVWWDSCAVEQFDCFMANIAVLKCQISHPSILLDFFNMPSIFFSVQVGIVVQSKNKSCISWGTMVYCELWDVVTYSNHSDVRLREWGPSFPLIKPLMGVFASYNVICVFRWFLYVTWLVISYLFYNLFVFCNIIWMWTEFKKRLKYMKF